MNMKTNSLSINAINHLKRIGYELQDTVDALNDAPYLFIIDNKVSAVLSNKTFRYSSERLVKEEFILKLRPFDEKKKIKKLSKREQIAYKLLSILNKSANSKITGYDVSWDIKESRIFLGHLEIFPISSGACGSISLEHLKLILNFTEKYSCFHFSFSYTDIDNGKEKYGIYRPCITIY